MKKLLVILGPTATGKTDLALNLAKKFNGELVACDSRQVYTGLDIGTGKEPSEECKVERGKSYWLINGIRIWMYDVVSPKEQYTVADYVKDAGRVVDDIFKRGKSPIIVGGTGLYLKAFLEGLPNLSLPLDQTLRKKLEKLTIGELQEKLIELSPGQLEKLNESDRRNPRRLIRRIELISSASMNPYTEDQNNNQGLARNFDVLKIGLTAPRSDLYQRIDRRVLSRIKQGMVQEVEYLHKNGLSLKRMHSLGLEYGVLADFLDGKINSIDELIKVMQGKIHGYLRRQQTWFKKEKNVEWFDIIDRDFMDKVDKMVVEWYHSV